MTNDQFPEVTSPPGSGRAGGWWPPARFGPAVALAVIVTAALGLRLFGLNWDDGRDLHPDELYVAKLVLTDRIFFTWPPDWDNLLDPERSGLNPRSADPSTGTLREYPYGALPLLVTDTAATILGWITGDNWNASDRAYLVGRALSAVLDTLTVIVVYVIGARVFAVRVGLFAALFAALAPMSIQLAHFFTTDSWLTFFVSITLYCSIRGAESGAVRWYVASGLGFGLALATKGSVFALAGLIGAALVYDGWRRWRAGGSVVEAVWGLPHRFGVAAIGALLGFALFEPYVFARPGIFLLSLQRQAEIVSGSFDIAFTRVFIGTIPVVYQAEQFVRWGFGPVAGLLSLAGVIALGRRFGRELSAGQWILLCWLIGYGLVISVPEVKFLRYLAPLVPALAITAALALDALVRWLHMRAGPRLATTLLIALLVGSALWTVAFASIYAVEHPRLAASRWIYANVAAGSTLSWEYWDDALPKPLGPGLTQADYQYQLRTIDLYRDQDPVALADELYATLEQLDYVVQSSDRIAAAVPRSPWRYPVQIQFLDLLRSGELGFLPVAEFHVTPRLGPIRFDDRAADESFINYDHPRVTIYQKTALVNRADFDLLMAWAVARPSSATRYPTQPSLLLDEPVGDLPIVADARWSANFTQHSAAAMALWILFLLVLQAVGWPLVRVLFPRFADLGWGLARFVLILIGGYVVWIGASLHLLEFRATSAWAVVAALAGAAWLIARRFPIALGRHQRRSIIGAEVTFWAVFALFLLYRYLNPDGWHPIWGGEKPMEFAHLNATLRSAHFPPFDPWYADGYINYYYYGLYLIAFCLKLTGIPAEIGFNLAQPTVIALLAAAGFTVAATLGRDLTRQARLAIPAGALGAVMLLAIGNLTSLGRLLSGAPLDFGSFLDWVWAGSRAIDNAITEFPYFTALYADLHAHVIALPITVLAIGLTYGLMRSTTVMVNDFRRGRRSTTSRQVVLQVLLLMLVLGTLFPTNAWDVPAYAALTVGAVLLGSRLLTDWRWRATWIGGVSLVTAGGAYLLFRPFHDRYLALFGSLGLVQDPTSFLDASSHIGGLAAIAVLGLIVLLIPRRFAGGWPLGQPALVVCVVLFSLLLTTVASRVQPALAPAAVSFTVVMIGSVAAIMIWTTAQSHVIAPVRRGLFIAIESVVLASALLALAVGQPVLAGYLIMVSLALAVWLTGSSLTVRFVALLFLAASSIGAGTEVVFVADDLISTTAYRMNTVFKFYNQIWVLLALAGAPLVTLLAFEAGWIGRAARGRPAASQVPGRSVRAGWARVGLIVAAVVIAGSFTYPLFATLPRLQQRFEAGLGAGTLNALDWMSTGSLTVIGESSLDRLAFADDRAAIDWLNQNVAGSPVIAEASIGPYRCNGSRVSIATGLPTIIGWERHQQQQRYPEVLSERVADVRTLYSATDVGAKEAILRKYNVAYVIVGDLERYSIRPSGNDCVASEPEAGVAVFDDMLGDVLEIAFAQGNTTIYRVLPVVNRGRAGQNGAWDALA